MSDLIDREELIYSLECLPFYHEFWKTEGYEGLWKSEDVINRIKNMPSSQQWVPVTERLPDKDVPVFVYLFGDSPYIVWINRDGEWQTEEFIIDCDYLPKAWMPLPEPWKGEENDK